MERLESQARRLAAACVLAQRQRVNSPLLKRFVENQRVLIQRSRVKSSGTIARRSRASMPTGWPTTFTSWTMCCARFARTFRGATTWCCPSSGVPPLSGFPRVYALAVTLIAHTDSELDEPKITRFVQAFQEVVPLTIGELWALPTMFRLVLLENLRRLAEQMLRGWEERRRAERWFEQAMAVAESAGIDASRKLQKLGLHPWES